MMPCSKRLIPGSHADNTSLDYNSRPAWSTDFQIELFPLHSPLLGESLLVSFPPLNNMLKFRGYSRFIWDLIRKIVTKSEVMNRSLDLFTSDDSRSFKVVHTVVHRQLWLKSKYLETFRIHPRVTLSTSLVKESHMQLSTEMEVTRGSSSIYFKRLTAQVLSKRLSFSNDWQSLIRKHSLQIRSWDW